MSRGISRRGGYGLSFGPAPYEETLGEGLRLHATMLSGPLRRMGVSDVGSATNKIFTGFTSGTTSTITSCMWTSLYSSSGGTTSMWRNSAATMAPLEIFLKLFSKFCVRRLIVRYVPLVSTSIGGSLVLGASFEGGDTVEESDFTTISGLTKSVRTPLWQQASLVAIADRDMGHPAMRLYDTEPNTQSLFSQAMIIGAVDSLPVNADTIGHLEFEVVVDCYQFKRLQSSAMVMSLAPATAQARCLTMDEDYVTCSSASTSSADSAVVGSKTSSIKPLGKVLRP